MMPMGTWPLYVGIHTKVANHAYWVTYTARDVNDQVVTYTQKPLEILKKEGNHWLFIAGGWEFPRTEA